MEQMGLTRADLVPIIGRRSRVSEVLNRLRDLTIAMIARLREKLHAHARVPQNARKRAQIDVISLVGEDDRAAIEREAPASTGRRTPTPKTLGSSRSNVARGAYRRIPTAVRTGPWRVPRSNRSSADREDRPGRARGEGRAGRGPAVA